MVKICLDAGHYGKYNRSPAVTSYYESEMNWKLHLLLKKYLEQYGIEVIATREDQKKDMGLKARGQASKGCNLFLSIHSNATGSAVDETTDYPLVIVPISGSGDAIGEKLAKCIETTMGTKQKGRTWEKKSDSGKDWYGVINGATSVGVPGLILEHSFHTNTKMAKWLSDDANLDKLARAEAEVIASHYGVKKPAEVVTKTLYTISAIRTVESKAEADKAVSELKGSGYSVSVSEKTVETVVEKPVATKPVLKSVDEIAKEVINGNWGNGAERKHRLEAAGYSYSQVQKRVNELCK
jgi:N-acetylmuramoyl-L-alanine amidase